MLNTEESQMISQKDHSKNIMTVKNEPVSTRSNIAFTKNEKEIKVKNDNNANESPLLTGSYCIIDNNPSNRHNLPLIIKDSPITEKAVYFFYTFNQTYTKINSYTTKEIIKLLKDFQKDNFFILQIDNDPNLYEAISKESFNSDFEGYIGQMNKLTVDYCFSPVDEYLYFNLSVISSIKAEVLEKKLIQIIVHKTGIYINNKDGCSDIIQIFTNKFSFKELKRKEFFKVADKLKNKEESVVNDFNIKNLIQNQEKFQNIKKKRKNKRRKKRRNSFTENRKEKASELTLFKSDKQINSVILENAEENKEVSPQRKSCKSFHLDKNEVDKKRSLSIKDNKLASIMMIKAFSNIINIDANDDDNDGDNEIDNDALEFNDNNEEEVDNQMFKSVDDEKDSKESRNIKLMKNNDDDNSYFYNNNQKADMQEILDGEYKFLSPGEDNSSPQLDVKLKKQSRDDMNTNQKDIILNTYKSEKKVSRIKSGFKEDLTNFHYNTQNKDTSKKDGADHEKNNDTIRSFKEYDEKGTSEKNNKIPTEESEDTKYFDNKKPSYTVFNNNSIKLRKSNPKVYSCTEPLQRVEEDANSSNNTEDKKVKLQLQQKKSMDSNKSLLGSEYLQITNFCTDDLIYWLLINSLEKLEIFGNELIIEANKLKGLYLILEDQERSSFFKRIHVMEISTQVIFQEVVIKKKFLKYSKSQFKNFNKLSNNFYFKSSFNFFVELMISKVTQLEIVIEKLQNILRMIKENYSITIEDNTAQQNIKLNMVMKVLAIITTIYAPFDIVASLFGMNIRVPFQDNETLWPFFGLLMVLFILFLGQLLLFKKLKWF